MNCINRALATSAALAVCLTATGACAASGGPSDADAVRQIEQYLRRMGYSIPFPSSQHSCLEHFELGQVRITDTMVQGQTARVIAVYPVRAKVAVKTDTFQGLNCYAQPRGGWSAGQRLNVQGEYRFEKWSSGWRLAR